MIKQERNLLIVLMTVCLLCGCAGNVGREEQHHGTETEVTSQEAELASQTESEGTLPIVGSEESPTEETQESSTETAADYRAAFYRDVLSDSVKARITGISYPADDEETQITYGELAYVHVLYCDFDGEVQEGELVCNRAIADDLVEIFQELYENRYPIEKIRLVDEYGGDDDASMEDNNTSCFNYRPVAGTNRLSKHAYGLAIDINPLYNPYVTTRNGEKVVSPEAGAAYADRSKEFEYKIDENDLCYQLFAEHGFTWGGSWINSKDYQHFQKEL